MGGIKLGSLKTWPWICPDKFNFFGGGSGVETDVGFDCLGRRGKRVGGQGRRQKRAESESYWEV